MPPTRPWRDVLTFILGCEFVISSSLHGLILAEAFGVPARWWCAPELKSAVTESQFKYNDYYLSTGRSSDDWCSTIEEARARGGKEPPAPQVPTDPLLEAFPREHLEAATPLDSLAWLARRAVRSLRRRS